MTPVLQPKKDAGETVPTSVRLPRTMLEELNAAAKATGLSRNEAVVQLLRYALDADKQKPKK